MPTLINTLDRTKLLQSLIRLCLAYRFKILLLTLIRHQDTLEVMLLKLKLWLMLSTVSESVASSTLTKNNIDVFANKTLLSLTLNSTLKELKLHRLF